MKVKIQQFLFGKSHSWSVVGQNIGRALLHRGHEVHFVSTDGIESKYHPEDLRKHTRESPDNNYDMQLSYTAPHNWGAFTQHGSKNKFVIWNYEYNKKDGVSQPLLQGFGKYSSLVDRVLPSSNFTRDVFLSMGVPSEKMIVVPHGINLKDYDLKDVFKINCKRSKKILLNIAQPHKRKAIPLALRAFGKAFKKSDDVVLVAKILKDNKKDMSFDVDFPTLYKTFEREYPNHAPVEIIYDYIPNITSLYNACDINFSATHAECWHLPSLEALATGLLNVVPRYGGILDFCSDNNSLLIDGHIIKAPADHQYWMQSPFAVHYKIDVDDAVKKLRMAVDDYDNLLEVRRANMANVVSRFTWDNVARQLEELCQ